MQDRATSKSHECQLYILQQVDISTHGADQKVELTWDVCRGTKHEGPSIDSEEDLPSQGECPERLWEEGSGAGDTVRQSYCGPRGSLGWSMGIWLDRKGQAQDILAWAQLQESGGIRAHKSKLSSLPMPHLGYYFFKPSPCSCVKTQLTRPFLMFLYVVISPLGKPMSTYFSFSLLPHS